jgi:hypothetical protein
MIPSFRRFFKPTRAARRFPLTLFVTGVGSARFSFLDLDHLRMASELGAD